MADNNHKRDFKVRAPGEPVAAAQMPPQQPAAVADEQVIDGPEVLPDPSDVRLDVAALTDDQLMVIAAEIQRRKVKRQESSALPDQADVDVEKLARPVLTKQGWLCPKPKHEPKLMR